MVSEKIIDGKTYYQCDICKFYYKTRELAQQCEDFCNKYKSCSIEITKQAVQLDDKNGAVTDGV